MVELDALIAEQGFEERRRRYRARSLWADVPGRVERVRTFWERHLGLLASGQPLLAEGALDRCYDEALGLAATPTDGREAAARKVACLRTTAGRLAGAARLVRQDRGYSMLAIAAHVEACLWSLRCPDVSAFADDEVEPILGEATGPSARDLRRRATPRGLGEFLDEIACLRADREALEVAGDRVGARGASVSIVPTLLRCLHEPASTIRQLESKRLAMVEHGGLLAPVELASAMVGPQLTTDCLLVGASPAQEARLWSPLRRG